MPLFIITGYDVADSAQLRQSARPDHLARLEDLNHQHRLVMAGPTPLAHGESQMSGSLIIADFKDLASVQAWVTDEPYLKAGVYSHVDIKPFVQVLPVPEHTIPSSPSTLTE